MLSAALRLLHRALGLTLARAVLRWMRRDGAPVTPQQRERLARRLHPEIVARRRRSYARAVEQIREFDPAVAIPEPEPYPISAVVSALERAVEPPRPVREPDPEPEPEQDDESASEPERREPREEPAEQQAPAEPRSRARVTDSNAEPPAGTGSRARITAPEEEPRQRARVTGPDATDRPRSRVVAPADLDPKSRSQSRARVVAPTLENRTDPTVVRQVAERVTATLTRHVAMAGRDAIVNAAMGAGEEIGWARVLSGAENCAFCAMLASRGPVYKSDKSALVVGGNGGRIRGSRAAGERFHDNCDCETILVRKGQAWEGREEYERLEHLWIAARTASNALGEAPRQTFSRAFRRIDNDPALGEEIERMWAEATEGLTGSAVLRAFERAVKENPPAALAARRGASTDTDQNRPDRNSSTPRERTPRTTQAESDREVAERQLPALRATLKRLLAEGRSEDSEPVKYQRRMIAKFERDLK